MTALERLHERQQAAKRLSDLYAAEWHGLLRAEFADGFPPFSSDADRQSRFELGFREGREILAVGDDQTEVTHAALDSH